MGGQIAVKDREAVEEPRVRVSIHGPACPLDDMCPDDALVVVDVIRAFTTACVAFARGATEVLCVRGCAQALRAAPEALIVGETEAGTLPPGAVANSPTAVNRWDLRGYAVALFSVNGTNVLATAPSSGVLLATAAVNTSATASWILGRGITRTRVVVSDVDAPEDLACAEHLAGLLTKCRGDASTLARRITAARTAHWNRWGEAVSSEVWRTFESDVDVCARPDRYPIAMVADRSSGPAPVLRPSVAPWTR